MDFLWIFLVALLNRMGRNFFGFLQILPFILLGGIGAASGVHAAETRVSDAIAVDTVWRPSGSPYILQGAVVLEQGALLTIEPGTEIQMESGASFSLKQGALRAKGTASQPILVTSSKQNKAPGDWGLWRFLSGTRSGETVLEHVRFEYGSGLVLEEASPVLNRVSIKNHSGPAIRMDLKSSPLGYGLEATGNEINAAMVAPGVISAQVTWGLTGIPYLVQQGLVEVGRGNQMQLDPQTFRVGVTESAFVRLILEEPAPVGGQTVAISSAPAGYIDGPIELNIPEGAKEVQFSVEGRAVGSGVLTVAHADLGSAQANFSAFELPLLELNTQHASVALQMPYLASVRLPVAAPAGGVKIQLSTEPPGWAELPSEIAFAEGQQISSFVFKPATSGGFDLVAKSQGFKSAAARVVSSQMVLAMEAEKFQSPILTEETRSSTLRLSHPAPVGGLDVNVATTSPSIAAPVAPTLSIPEGANTLLDGIRVRGVAKGSTFVQVYASGAVSAFAAVTVKDPVALTFRIVGTYQTLYIGSGTTNNDSVFVVRTVRGQDLEENFPLKVNLKCVAQSFCSVPASVIIPAGQSKVRVPVEGLISGSTTIEATAENVIPGSLPVVVEVPGAAFIFHQTYSYVGQAADFTICLSGTDSGSAEYQVNNQDRFFDLRLINLEPEYVAMSIRDAATGADVERIRIAAGERCFNGLSVTPELIGSFRIAAIDSLERLYKSPTIFSTSARGLDFDTCGDGCREITVGRGLKSDFTLRTTNMGNGEPTPDELIIRLKCVDESICTVPSQITIPANTGGWGDGPTISISGIAIGETEVTAEVINLPNLYSDIYRTRVVVEDGGFYFPEWNPQFRVSPTPREMEVCISSWRSYPGADFSLSIQSSNTSVVVPVSATHTWQAGQTCQSFNVQIQALGSAELSVHAPGLTSGKIAIEVRQ